MHLKIPPLVLTILVAVFMQAIVFVAPRFVLPVPGSIYAACAIAIAGAVVCIAGLRLFRIEKTTVNPTRPDAVSTLVTGGIYRYSRNPMYLGFLLFLIAWGVYLEHVLSLVLLPSAFVVYMNRFQINAEEKALEEKYNETYLSYRNNVRRWV